MQTSICFLQQVELIISVLHYLCTQKNTYGTIQEDKRHIQQQQRQGDKHARERFLAFFYKCTSTIHQAAFGNAWCY